MSTIPNPHDVFVKSIFSRVSHAADELRSALPAALVERMDLRTLALCSGSFADDELREHFVDLLFSVTLAGADAFVWCLIEHQSTAAPLMPLRVWRYKGNIWDRYVKDHPGTVHLPFIVPLVIHHSATRWTAATDIRDLFERSSELQEVVNVDRMALWVDDLSTQADEQLRGRVMDAVPKLALWALKNARDSDALVQTMTAWAGVFRDILHAPHGVDALGTVLRYILQVSDVDPNVVEAFLVKHVSTAAKEAYMTAAEVLQQQARDEADARLRSMLAKQLNQRFGPVPAEVVERINQADADQLQSWMERVVVASSLTDVLDGVAEQAQVSAAEHLQQKARREVLCTTLSMQLEQRFGTLPEKVLKRIEQADGDQLQGWMERVVVASSLDDIFV
ncbi:MAG: Rpn family recombination-promoting nuclease/putative transposase [Proteobacteria bacterium]|nr:Rpn family recombination-promoting nuclease/putative transposase [Pseudomonadota bacterium]